MPALWLPGTDHATIATEVKIVEPDGGRGPHKRGRSASRRRFMERAWAWKEQYGGRIVVAAEKARAPPATGRRERFTMDEGC